MWDVYDCRGSPVSVVSWSVIYPLPFPPFGQHIITSATEVFYWKLCQATIPGDMIQIGLKHVLSSVRLCLPPSPNLEPFDQRGSGSVREQVDVIIVVEVFGATCHGSWNLIDNKKNLYCYPGGLRFWVLNFPKILPQYNTWHNPPSYGGLITSISFSGIRSALQIRSPFTLSKVVSKSMKSRWSGALNCAQCYSAGFITETSPIAVD